MFSFVVFCLLQVMILNHIHLFGFITPLFYVYFLLSFEYNYPRWGILLWAFVMGVILDTFTNTPGVAAASMTFVAFIQPYFLELFVGSDASDDTSASVRYALYILCGCTRAYLSPVILQPGDVFVFQCHLLA